MATLCGTDALDRVGSDFSRISTEFFFYWVSAAGATVDLHWANEGAVPSWNGIVPSLQLITLTESFTGFF